MRKLAVLALIVSTTVLAQPKPNPTPKPPAMMPTAGPLGPAIDAIKAGDYAAAEKALAPLKTQDALSMLARVQMDQGKYAEAEKTIASFPTKAEGVPLRAKMLFDAGKTAEAVKLLDASKNEKGRPGNRINVLLGEYLIETGRRADAEAPLMTLIGDYNNDVIKDTDAEGMALVGRAAYLLRSFKDASSSFQSSEGAQKTVQVELWMAEMFLDKYNPGDAGKSIKYAEQIAPKNPELLVMKGRYLVEDSLDFDEIEKVADAALQINPKMYSAYALKAGLALRDNDVVVADKHIAAGLAINPNDLELLSLKAASKFLADDAAGFEQAKKDVLSRNAEYSTMYSIISEYAEWEHRYDDIVTMMKEALKVDPKDAKALAQLGLMQMRAGDDDEGLKNLQSAFTKDKYNVRVYNTLNLYENNIATDYDLVTEGVFKIRYPKATEAVLKRYVPRLLGQAWASMKSRYGFVPQNPVQVELYEDAATRGKRFIQGAREQFGVRTSGLGHIAIQGVCFGKVLAAMGPHSEAFNWGNVLWHELGHVYAIQLSKAHVPRWFTEGLSEYETIAQRPEWRRTLDPELYQALIKNTLPGANDMNRAFTHAGSAQQMVTAYYAASQMMVFTVEQFGMPKVVKALELWGKGLRTPEVLKQAFGVSDKEYDAKFRAWALARLERFKGQFFYDRDIKPLDEAKAMVQKAPGDASAHVELAKALGAEGDGEAAVKEIEAALKLDPKNQTAHFLYAKIAMGDHDRESAEKHLQEIQRAGGDGYTVSMLMGNLAELRKDKDAQKAAFENAWRYDPTQPEPLTALYDLAKKDKRDAEALDILRKLAPLSQHDPKVWRLYLAALLEQKQFAEAVKAGESAIFVDVGTPKTHTDFGKALEAQGDHARAIFEAESALACAQVTKKDGAEAHALMAAAYVSLKKPGDAKKHKDEALKLDPDCVAAKQLPL